MEIGDTKAQVLSRKGQQMKNMFKKPHDIMLYKERTEFEEFGRAKKDFRECRQCKAVYYKKSWHHLDSVDVGQIKKAGTIGLTLCPACQMIKDHQYEGELTIENIPKRFRGELFHMIKAYLKRASDKDCQHRLAALVKEDASTWRVTVTENQLANKLAQKIRDVFDSVEVKVAYSKAPDDVERVVASFKPRLSLPPLKEVMRYGKNF